MQFKEGSKTVKESRIFNKTEIRIRGNYWVNEVLRRQVRTSK
jgi:hypothetical protein